MFIHTTAVFNLIKCSIYLQHNFVTGLLFSELFLLILFPKNFRKILPAKRRFVQKLPTKTSCQAKKRTTKRLLLLLKAKRTQEKRPKTLKKNKNSSILRPKKIVVPQTPKTLLPPVKTDRLLKEDLKTNVLELRRKPLLLLLPLQ